MEEEAARLLDAKVAQEVMGWEPSIVANYPWQMIPPGPREYVDMSEVTIVSDPNGGPYDGPAIAKVKIVPRYSTDAAAAVELLESLAPYGPSAYTTKEGWGVHFNAGGPTGYGRTFPEAACDASLKMAAVIASLEKRGVPRKRGRS